jgi:hypothetical protein
MTWVYSIPKRPRPKKKEQQKQFNASPPPTLTLIRTLEEEKEENRVVGFSNENITYTFCLRQTAGNCPGMLYLDAMFGLIFLNNAWGTSTSRQADPGREERGWRSAIRVAGKSGVLIAKLLVNLILHVHLTHGLQICVKCFRRRPRCFFQPTSLFLHFEHATCARYWIHYGPSG